MKVQYKFSVKGRLRTSGAFPIQSDGAEYVISTGSDGLLTDISISYELIDRSLWPQLTKDPEPGISANIVMHSPYLERAQETIRAAEGILAFFGIESIEWNNPEEIYIPESDEERTSLDVFSMSRIRKKSDATDSPEIPYDLVARPLLRAKNLSHHEIPLAFFRKGKNDIREDRHIEACIDLLFMIETLFANGKFKTAQVIREYTSCKLLMDSIFEVKSDANLVALAKHHGTRHLDKLKNTYLSKEPSEIAERIVALRGELHHHTLNDKDRWHPELHDNYLSDALFLSQVCYLIGFQLISSEIFSKEAEEEYLQQFRENRSITNTPN